VRSVLILGGYGNFGKRISGALAKAGVPIIIAGRRKDKARALSREIGREQVEIAGFDANANIDAELERLKPGVVVNTCGPFQNADYKIAQACIRHGVHYIDLADGRDFVTGIGGLDAQARRAGVTIISGASTVPGLSSAVLEHFQFAQIDLLKYGISPGQQAERGLATTSGILSYVGKPLKPFPGGPQTRYGWQDIYRHTYPDIGKRWMANCDIPDLDLLPARYGISRIQFSAGLELGILHLGLWGLSWLVRAGIPLNLPRFAQPLLSIANLFNRLGTADGGMHVRIEGKDHNGHPLTQTWAVIAWDGHGPHIPTVPAIVLAKKLVSDAKVRAGAYPCVGLLSLEEYVLELKDFHVKTYGQSQPAG